MWTKKRKRRVSPDRRKVVDDTVFADLEASHQAIRKILPVVVQEEPQTEEQKAEIAAIWSLYYDRYWTWKTGVAFGKDHKYRFDSTGAVIVTATGEYLNPAQAGN